MKIWKILLLMLLISSGLKAQVVDKIDGIVDKRIILRSEVESQVQLIAAQGAQPENIHCDVFDQMLLGKLLVAQAVLDSVTVSDDEVEDELDRKISYYINMIGSKEQFEEYYGKSVDAIKDEFREEIRDQLIASRMREKVVGDIEITPSEVRNFFESIPEDSLPYFNTEMELSEIVITTKVNPEQKQAARDKAEDIRKRIMEGEEFDLFCQLYSEDESSKANNCELGYVPRGTFVDAFEAAAWNLEVGEISNVVETQFGFHIIELIGRRGEMINVRHILIKAQTTRADKELTKQKLDSLRHKIVTDSMSFFYAVKEFSEDKYSKDNGGVVLSPRTGGTLLSADDLEPNVFFMVDTLEVGEISVPVPHITSEGKDAFRIIKVDSKTPPHVANLEDDWNKIYEVARNNKQSETLETWVKKKARKTYIMIDDRYKLCPNITSWLN